MALSIRGALEGAEIVHVSLASLEFLVPVAFSPWLAHVIGILALISLADMLVRWTRRAVGHMGKSTQTNNRSTTH